MPVATRLLTGVGMAAGKELMVSFGTIKMRAECDMSNKNPIDKMYVIILLYETSPYASQLTEKDDQNSDLGVTRRHGQVSLMSPRTVFESVHS